MKKLIVASLAAVALATGSATAADMAIKAPSSPAYTWSGCYVGVNGGFGWNSGHSRYANDPNAPNPDIINGLPDPLGIAVLAFIPVPSPIGGSGGLGGGGAGCNWQSQQWVLGIEGDIDWAHISGSSTNVVANTGLTQFATGPGLFTPLLDTGTANEQVSLRWLSTFRGRAGFAI